MWYFRSAVIVLCVSIVFGVQSFAIASDPAHIEGEYECDDCYGFLTVKHLDSTKFQVWFGVGHGSCGSEPPLIRKVKYVGGVLKLPYKVEQKQCTTQIKFTDGGALITDSCFTAQDMADSTCATLGSYTKRK